MHIVFTAPYWPPENIRSIVYPNCTGVRIYWRHLDLEPAEDHLNVLALTPGKNETGDSLMKEYVDVTTANNELPETEFYDVNVRVAVAEATTAVITEEAAIKIILTNDTRVNTSLTFHIVYWDEETPGNVTSVQTQDYFVDFKELEIDHTYWLRVTVQNQLGIGPTSEPASFTVKSK